MEMVVGEHVGQNQEELVACWEIQERFQCVTWKQW